MQAAAAAAKQAAEQSPASEAAAEEEMAATQPLAAKPAAVKTMPLDAAHLGTDELAAAPAMAKAASPADTERWDVDADDDTVCDSDDASQVWLRAVLLHCILPPPLSNAPQPRGDACKKPKGATVAECNRS